MRSVPILSRVARFLGSSRRRAEAYRADVRELRDLVIAHDAYIRQYAHPNPINRYGAKCFSQSDEDGITMEILGRMGAVQDGVFAEFGVGNGTENNTLVLKALGWRGFWVGGEPLAFDVRQAEDRFSFTQAWVTLENVVKLAEDGRRRLKSKSIDVLSIDLDGNDFYLVQALLASGIAPKLFIVEYNARFPPPVKWKIDFDPSHTWKGDDYFGASLACFVELFEGSGFRLVCCNGHTGANAFFVREEFESSFADVPKDVRDIYVPPWYYLRAAYGHPPSRRTVAKLFS